ncbi:MAG: hypothetical protein DI631_07350, partial [Acinetobacter johnsonii]
MSSPKTRRDFLKQASVGTGLLTATATALPA